MADSRQKGARAEAAVVKLLKADTGLNWKRVPGSGALHEDHGLKGDVYVPNEKNYWSVEVKHYKDSHLNSKILTDKEPMFLTWWAQAVRQAKQTDKKPILFFKHDRSKWFVAFRIEDIEVSGEPRHFILFPEGITICEYDSFKKYCMEKIKWIK